MKRYVVGFAFGETTVALIRKARPEWQRGKLNGVGGHIEPGELPLDAMRREWAEETGWNPVDWRLFATLAAPDWTMWCFRADAPSNMEGAVADIGDATDEFVDWYDPSALDGCVSNLRWLVPMAVRDDEYGAWPFMIHERAGNGEVPEST